VDFYRIFSTTTATPTIFTPFGVLMVVVVMMMVIMVLPAAW
jgi:hypothetical protein